MTVEPTITLNPIGQLESPFKQKFGIPRQPALANAKGRIKLLPPFNDINCLRGLETYSHVWLIFLFHQNRDKGWTPTVRAPRLGGNRRIGVYASRSTFRPNSIGMSAVENHGIEQCDADTYLKVGNIDLLDGTPIVDIKPYIPYSDSIETAQAELIKRYPIPNLPVQFSRKAMAQLASQPHEDLIALIRTCLAQDPRPAYKHTIRDDPKCYRVQFYEFDILWQVAQGEVNVLSIESL